MYHPTRGGTRGGAAEFSWEQVRQDKDRENYLGHSVLAPTGRWQKNKDVNWYNKDATATGDGDAAAAGEARRQELMAIKQREEEEINRRLGRKPGQSSSASTPGEALLRGSEGQTSTARGTGSNTAPLDRSKQRWGAAKDDAAGGATPGDTELTKEEHRYAQKLAKREVRQQRHEERQRRREERRAARKSTERRSGDDRADDFSSESSTDERRTRHRRHHRHRGSYSRSRSPAGRRRRDSTEPRQHDRFDSHSRHPPHRDADVREEGGDRSQPRRDRRDDDERKRWSSGRHDDRRDNAHYPRRYDDRRSERRDDR